MAKDGSLKPYPDVKWNSWRNARANEVPVGDYFVCVQSIVPDGHGNLRVLDPGAPGNEKILEGAPKLVRIDLSTDRVTKVIAVPGDVALQGTYLNDIRFSPDGIAISNDGKTLYYQALTGKTLYSIDTAKLRPEVSEADRAAAVRVVAETHVADGLWMSKAGVLYLTSPSDYAGRAAVDQDAAVLVSADGMIR